MVGSWLIHRWSCHQATALRSADSSRLTVRTSAAAERSCSAAASAGPVPGSSSRDRGTKGGAAPTLREHALWRVLHDSAVPAEEVLRLNTGSLDPGRHRGRAGPPWPAPWIEWGAASTELLRWLAAGRPEGPVFLTSRRAPAGTPGLDVCPLTGRARLSYRRAAEIFTEVTRPLDPAGRGWTLSQLHP